MTDTTDNMLTTVDNPFDPFTQYMDWFWWDYHAGYHTPGVLARQVISSNDLSEADQTSAINTAIDEIVAENVSGVHKKVSRTENN